MANVTVGVSVVDHDDNSVDEVKVLLFNRNTQALLDTQVTGTAGSGRAAFTLNGSRAGTTYLLRAFLIHDPASLFAPLTEFDHRSQITVYDPPLAENNDENEFTLAIPDPDIGLSSPDSDLCRCHFRAVRFDKAPIPNYQLRIRHEYDPETYHGGEDAPLQGGLIASDYITLITDKNGFASIDLFRGGRYEAWLPIRAENSVLFAVPDQASADLVDLIWLYPREVVFETTTVSLAVGDTITVDVASLKMSDGRTIDLDDNPYSASTYADLYTTDDDVVALSWDGEGIRIEGLQSGTCEVSLVVKDYRTLGIPIRNPQPPLTQVVIQVTVT